MVRDAIAAGIFNDLVSPQFTKCEIQKFLLHHSKARVDSKQQTIVKTKLMILLFHF